MWPAKLGNAKCFVSRPKKTCNRHPSTPSWKLGTGCHTESLNSFKIFYIFPNRSVQCKVLSPSTQLVIVFTSFRFASSASPSPLSNKWNNAVPSWTSSSKVWRCAMTWGSAITASHGLRRATALPNRYKRMLSHVNLFRSQSSVVLQKKQEPVAVKVGNCFCVDLLVAWNAPNFGAASNKIVYPFSGKTKTHALLAPCPGLAFGATFDLPAILLHGLVRELLWGWQLPDELHVAPREKILLSLLVGVDSI